MFCRPICISGFVSMLALIGAGSVFAAAPIGAVSEPNTKDTVAIPAAGGAARDLHYEAAVFQNDTVVTRDLGTSLQFTDQTLLKVSSNSRVVLDSFVFDAGSGTLDGKVKLGVGVFRLVSGALVKHDNLQLVTPVTTLTIRGTDLVVAVEGDGTTRLRLYEGSIRVKTCNGTTIWMHANQRIVISPACTLLVQNANTGEVVADSGTQDSNGNGTGTGGTGTGGDPGAGGGTGTGTGGGDPGAGGGTGTGGGDPSGGGGSTGGGDPSGGDPNSGGKDPGTGNSGTQGLGHSGPGTGNGGSDNGNGNGGDPGNK